MPRHKESKRHSSSRRSKRDLTHKHRSRTYTRERKSRDRSQHRKRSHSSYSPDRTSSKVSSDQSSFTKNSCIRILEEIRRLVSYEDAAHNLQTRSHEVRSPTPDIPSVEVDPVVVSQIGPFAEEQIASIDRQTVIQTDRVVEPVVPKHTNENVGSSSMPNNVHFTDSPANAITNTQHSETLSEAQTLVTDLFREEEVTPSSSAWNPIILSSIQTKARVGLSKNIRSSLLTKYEVKADIAALAPPKLNKELIPALTPAALKRDEYQLSSQAQVGACLNAFGSGTSTLLRPENLNQLNDEARSALIHFSEGIHLLADHHFRISLARRAFAKPSFNILGINAADSATIDEFLFGKNFAETLKAAQACKKTDRDIARSSPLVGKKTLQPVRQQPPQRRSQPSTSRTQPPGNKRFPRPSTARHTAQWAKRLEKVSKIWLQNFD